MELSSPPGFPIHWNMSQTCFQVYGTKRKTTFRSDDEPENQFCSVAKKRCMVSTEGEMVEDCLPERPFPAITHQPFKQTQPDLSIPSPWQPMSQQESHTHSSPWHPAKRQMTNGIAAFQSHDNSGNETELCQNGHEVRCKSPDRSGNMQTGDEVRMRVSTPTVAIEGDSDSNQWQTPENVRRQMERQTGGPDLEQRRHEVLKAKAERLKTQLHYMKSMELESNDYWALPQENRLKMEDDLEQARIAMETDYVPDPYQYHCSDIPVPMPGHDSGISHQVHCYCKPNWEGMMDPVAYI